MMQNTGRFLNLFMDQNNKCNLKCRMCGFSDPRVQSIPKYDMPFRLFKKIAAEVFPYTQYFALSCLTEPLMTKDFSTRLDVLREFSVPFTEIITNGTLLSEDIICKMIDIPITRLAISIDGASPATYESVRTGAHFEKVIRNIRMFNEIKTLKGRDMPRLRINHVISEFNIHEFRAFLTLAESLEAASIDVRTIVSFRNAAYQGTKEGSFYRQLHEVREILSQWTQRTGIKDDGYLRTKFEEVELYDESGIKRICRRPWDSLAIHANGDVLPCITWTKPPLGNIAVQSFEEIWHGRTLKEIRREFEEQRPGIDCYHCTIKKRVRAEEDDDDCFFLMLNKRLPDNLSVTLKGSS
jgi:radical SAM protein with 4Fe4S-binding SPASM domain